MLAANWRKQKIESSAKSLYTTEYTSHLRRIVMEIFAFDPFVNQNIDFRFRYLGHNAPPFLEVTQQHVSHLGALINLRFEAE